MVTKTYDSSSKQFVTASPPTVIGTKKEDIVPPSPRAMGSFKINMNNLSKPTISSKKSIINPIVMKPTIKKDGDNSSSSEYSGDEQDTDK